MCKKIFLGVLLLAFLVCLVLGARLLVDKDNPLTYYDDFGVETSSTSFSRGGIGQRMAALSLFSATSAATNTPQYYSILVTGQSLALGALGVPALTVRQPYLNLMYEQGRLVPLIENYANPAVSQKATETVNSALANTISFLAGSTSPQFIISRSATNGAEMSKIKKNGNLSTYAEGLAEIRAIRDVLAKNKEQHKVAAIVLIHGETDHTLIQSGATNTYADDIRRLRANYDMDLRRMTGQSEKIPIFIDQMMSFTGYGQATSSIPLAQYAASLNDSNVYLVTPKYIFDYYPAGSQAHLVNISYRWLGEYYGKVIKQVVLDDRRWTPLSPRQILRTDRLVALDLNVPVIPIVFDTTEVLAAPNYGFEYYDGEKNIPISKVEIKDRDTLEITLAQIPTGASERLRYAYSGRPGARPGAHSEGSARGNVRDSDSTTSLYGNKLYNWLVAFDLPVTVGHSGQDGDNPPKDSSLTLQDVVLADIPMGGIVNSNVPYKLSWAAELATESVHIMICEIAASENPCQPLVSYSRNDGAENIIFPNLLKGKAAYILVIDSGTISQTRLIGRSVWFRVSPTSR